LPAMVLLLCGACQKSTLDLHHHPRLCGFGPGRRRGVASGSRCQRGLYPTANGRYPKRDNDRIAKYQTATAENLVEGRWGLETRGAETFSDGIRVSDKRVQIIRAGIEIIAVAACQQARSLAPQVHRAQFRQPRPFPNLAYRLAVHVAHYKL